LHHSFSKPCSLLGRDPQLRIWSTCSPHTTVSRTVSWCGVGRSQNVRSVDGGERHCSMKGHTTISRISMVNPSSSSVVLGRTGYATGHTHHHFSNSKRVLAVHSPSASHRPSAGYHQERDRLEFEARADRVSKRGVLHRHPHHRFSNSRRTIEGDDERTPTPPFQQFSS
jgi:hypothetical protein